MPMGRRGPGLFGMAARTAVVVGTANAVSNKQQQRYANQAAAQQEQQAAQQQAAPAAAPEDDLVSQLEALAKLRDQGILTEEEFSAKKAQLLGI